MIFFIKKKHTFPEAITALKEGKRIRRIHEKKGYAKLKGSGQHFFTYWVEDDDKTSTYCIFCMEDVLAEDWIID